MYPLPVDFGPSFSDDFHYPLAGRCPQCNKKFSGVWVYINLEVDILLLIYIHIPDEGGGICAVARDAERP